MKNQLVEIRDHFLAALERDGLEAQLQYAAEHCSETPEIRAKLEDMLRAHDQPEGFLDAQSDTSQPTSALPEAPGDVVGPYKLLQQIGEGGMGVIFMAEQTEPVGRRVAMKIIKPGMDSRKVIARFEAERQAVAMMDHPNIAKVLDAGTTDTGRPYFAMELVKGVAITQYCDEKQLTPRERLMLFVPICQAVQHAHQKGVIHRDIKPSNVLVAEYDDRAVPKIIDFGVAKAIQQRLTEKTVFTEFGQVVGTVEYMSPEQAKLNQLDIDTRTDVYSLGVLLYELLAGETPFDRDQLRSAAFDEMLRIIREEEPPRPSLKLSTSASLLSIAANRHIEPKQLSVLVHGELDWIVMKALEKDRSRRYDTASKLADDVQHYLDDEAVSACSPSAAYRLRKFSRRNKVAIVTSSAIAIALLIGTSVATWQAIRASQERDRALTAEQRSRNNELAAEEAKERAEEAQEQEAELRRLAEERLASSYVDRAQLLCEKGEIGRGMLWLAHSLQSAPQDATQLQHAIRANLAAWATELHSLRMVVQHHSTVRRAALSPDGQRILSVAGDGEFQLSDVATGQPSGEVYQHRGLTALAFSPDGSVYATASRDGTVQLWDATTLQSVGQPLPHDSEIKHVVFSPDGSQVAAATSNGTVARWNAKTGKPLGKPFRRAITDKQATEHNIRDFKFTAQGLRAVYTIRLGTHQLWDIDRGEAVAPPVIIRDTLAVSISPDGSRFATAGFRGVIRVWDAASGKLALEPILHGGNVRSLAFSHDGSRFVSGGYERSARLWDATSGKAIGVPMRHRGTVTFVAFGHDDTQILTGSEDGTARLWEIASDNSHGQPIQHVDGLLGAAYGPDALYILTESNGAFHLRNAATGQAIGGPFPQEHDGWHKLMALSPDGARVVINEHGYTRVWDVASGQSIGQLGERLSMHDATFSPDGASILAGYEAQSGGFAQLWNAETAEPIGDPLPHDDTVYGVAISPDGSQLMTGGDGAIIRRWDAGTLEPIGQPLFLQSVLKAVVFSPTGSRFVTSFSDWTARVWDAANLIPIGVPLHHQNSVTGVAFSPNGSLLVTGSRDFTARIWDVETLKPIGPLLEHSCPTPKVFFRPDGAEFLLTDKNEEIAHVWKSPPRPLDDDAERLVLWSQIVTGLERNSSGGIEVLTGSTWRERFERLQELNTAGEPLAPTDSHRPNSRSLGLRPQREFF